jgi:hypothetical protein
MVRSDGWATGVSERHPRTTPHTPSYDCTPWQHDTSFSTDSEKAVTWSGGLSVSQFGFNGEAQTGYDTDATVTFSLGTKRLLCGTNGLPDFASQLVARK